MSVCLFVCLSAKLPTCRSSAVFRIRVDAAAVVNSFVEFSLVDDGSPFEEPTLRLKRLLSPIDLASRIGQSRRGKSSDLRLVYNMCRSPERPVLRGFDVPLSAAQIEKNPIPAALAARQRAAELSGTYVSQSLTLAVRLLSATEYT